MAEVESVALALLRRTRVVTVYVIIEDFDGSVYISLPYLHLHLSFCSFVKIRGRYRCSWVGIVMLRSSASPYYSRGGDNGKQRLLVNAG